MDKNKKGSNLFLYISTVIIVGVFIVSLIFILTGINKNIEITFYSPINNDKKLIQIRKDSIIDSYLVDQKIEGYEFIGWFYDNNLNLKVEKGSSFSKDHTLFAGFSKILKKKDNNFLKDLKKESVSKFITIETYNDTYLTEEELLYISTLNLTYINIKNAEVQDGLIKEEYFSNNLKLETIKLSNNIQRICKNAFLGCINLRNIELNDGLLYIEDNAFSNCVMIDNIKIPNTIKSLGNEIFSSCYNLKYLKMPENLENIEDKTFFNSSINDLIIENNFNYKIYNNGLYSSDLKILYFIFGKNKEFILSDKTININDYASYGNKYIELIELNDKIEEIGSYSFKNCENLKNIKFKNCIEYKINDGAFENCKKLEKLNFSLGLSEIKNSSFKGCVSLNAVVFNLSVGSDNKNITKIGCSTFENCKKLEKFDFPDSVTDVGEKTFFGCSSLKNVTLSSGLKEIKSKMFSQCFSLTNVNFKTNSQLEKIGNYVFDSCKNLNTINLGEHIKEIGIGSFKGCLKLNNIDISNVEIIKENAFFNCNSLKDIYYNKVIKIESEAFKNCTNLTVFNINPNLEEISENAFDNCLSLEKFEIVEENEFFTVEDGVLYNKEKSKLLFFPLNKKNVKEFKIINELETIDDINFFYNKNIETFAIEDYNNNFSVIDGSLYNKSGTKLIKFANLKDKDSIILNVEEIGEFSFANNLYIKNLEISCSKLNKNCFTNMLNITNLTIPFLGEELNIKSNKYIAYFFGGDSYLDFDKIPKTLKYVKIKDDFQVYEYAFYGVKDIEKVEYDKANIVNKCAFYDCINLKQIIFNSPVEAFCEYSIYKLKNLESITFGFSVSLIAEKNSFGEIENPKINVYLSNNGFVLQNNQINFIKDKIYKVYNKADRWGWGNK